MAFSKTVHVFQTRISAVGSQNPSENVLLPSSGQNTKHSKIAFYLGCLKKIYILLKAVRQLPFIKYINFKTFMLETI